MLACIAVLMFSCVSCTTESPETSADRTGEISILPVPMKMTRQSGSFGITKTTQIFCGDADPNVSAVAGFLVGMIAQATGFTVAVNGNSPDPGRKGAIDLTISRDDESLGSEGYELTVEKDRITIRASYPAGLFYGAQTIRQLLSAGSGKSVGSRGKSPSKIPCVTIIDRPRYRWRGMHLDVSRHFFPKKVILTYLDLMAFHKMNTFHCHLVDGAGWRIEIERYPHLTEYGAWQVDTTGEPWSFTKIRAPEPGDSAKPYGGFYLAEVLWSAPQNRDWDDLKERMINQYRRFDSMNLTYAKSAFNVRFAITTEPPDFNAVVTMDSDASGVTIHYTLDGSDPTPRSYGYKGPITMQSTAVVRAGTFTDGELAGKVTSVEYCRHKATGRQPHLRHRYSKGYPGVGDLTLTNGLKGSKDYGDGQWQGYNGVDLEAVIDLGTVTTLARITSTYFHDPGTWIFMPSQVDYAVSDDGNAFQTVASLHNGTQQIMAGPFIKEFPSTFKPVSARYIRVTAKSIGVCPEWHAGAGKGAWLFSDEIVVE